MAFGNVLLLAAAFQVGPFYQQHHDDFRALRPLWSEQGETTDVLWPLFTAHRDWWRFCFFTHYQENREGGYQFEVMPIYWQGRARAEAEPYWGVFPLYGYHPHILLMHDFRYVLWPLYTEYRMPRPSLRGSEGEWMTSRAVLFPFFSWRSDGSWGFWPLYGVSHNRADDARYVLWPLFNWKTCFADRDSAGAGSSWMLWPLVARVDRVRESQWMFLPPFFSHAELPQGWYGRYPMPLVELERTRVRHRTSVFPFYESIVNYRYLDGEETSRLQRYGWRLVENLPDEFRVFPFWVSRPDDTYFRLWPFWESAEENGVRYSRFLSLFPIRWVDGVDRNWSKFWTFYEQVETEEDTAHYLLWGIIRWHGAGRKAAGR